MDIHFLAQELEQLDRLKCEAILSPLWSDERPPSGVLGLIDWRMCGFVSRMIVRGLLSGARGETVLVPLRPRFTVDKLFVFGLGPRSEFTEDALVPTVTRMLEVVSRAKVRTTALVLPGRDKGGITPALAMESFVAASVIHSEQDEVILLEPPDAQKEMEPIVQRERRRARASGG